MNSVVPSASGMLCLNDCERSSRYPSVCTNSLYQQNIVFRIRTGLLSQMQTRLFIVVSTLFFLLLCSGWVASCIVVSPTGAVLGDPALNAASYFVYVGVGRGKIIVVLTKRGKWRENPDKRWHPNMQIQRIPRFDRTAGGQAKWVVFGSSLTIWKDMVFDSCQPGRISEARTGILSLKFWKLLGSGFICITVCTGRGWLLRYWRRAKGHCAQCGYDVRASGEICSECGANVATYTNPLRTDD